MELYPYVEAIKVAAAYAVLLYIWPCVLFRRMLRGRGLTFRFLFCGVAQPVLISTVVLTLGLLHILNVWLVRALFWAPLAVSLLIPFWRWQKRGGILVLRLLLKDLIMRRYGSKLLFSRMVEAWRPVWRRIWRQYRNHFAEYFILAIILLFGMAFFLNGALQHYSFGCYDQHTHYIWTNAMVKGEIFSGGVYPEGMHSFLYGLHVLFGVRLYSCMVFLAGIHNSTTFLLAAYCLFKELFRNRHVPLFVLTAWLAFDCIGPDALESMNRMAWTLPEEFSLHLVFLCPLVLLRYFREQDKPEKWYRDENLLFLGAGVAFAASAHTFTLIMAFFSCCAVILTHCRELWPIRRMHPPVAAALYGLELGMLPMLAACAMGIKPEGSLRWGISLIRGVVGAAAELADPDGASPSRRNPLKALYEKGYLNLFGKTGAALVALLLLLVLVLAAVYVYKRRRGTLRAAALPAGMTAGYLTLVIAFMFFVLLYAMPYMGLPELVAIARILCVTQMFAFGAAGILVDLLLAWVGRWQGEMLPHSWMALGCLMVYLLAHMTAFQQCTYWMLFRYKSEATVTDRIMNYYPEGTYKIVSMDEETYQVPEESHEELFTFLESTVGENYFIPAEYIFLYIEKHPILWGQTHYLTAPHWMAQENYEDYTGSGGYETQCPEIGHGEISQELAEKETPYYPVMTDNYKNPTIRAILYSKADSWYQNFSAAHPAETNVYYEDDDFVCYVIHQDQNTPLKLAARKGGGV